MGESVDPADLKSAALIMRTGSSPVTGTKYLAGVMAAYQSPKLLVGVRVPGGMPKLNMEVWQSPVYCTSLEN